MRASLRGLLQLVRLPNLFTAAADSLAGFLFIGGAFADWSLAVRLPLCSMLLYAGGIALNDVCDFARDATERPDRPLPSGRVSRGFACGFSLVLLAAGVALAASISIRVGVVGLLIAAAVVAYDWVLKQTIIAPAIMGVCRALNLMLGVIAVTSIDTPAHWLPAFLMWSYVTGLTAFARNETQQSRRPALAASAALMMTAFVGLAVFGWAIHRAPVAALVAPIAVAFVLARPVLRAVRTGLPGDVQSSVGVLIAGIVMFDACLVLMTRSVWYAVAVLALIVPARVCARYIKPT